MRKVDGTGEQGEEARCVKATRGKPTRTRSEGGETGAETSDEGRFTIGGRQGTGDTGA